MDSAGATATALLSFLVLPENDPPVLQSTSATYDPSARTHDGMSDVVDSVDVFIVTEDQGAVVPGLSVRDVDLDSGGALFFGGGPGPTDNGLIEITLYASNGTTSLGSGASEYIFLAGDGVDDGIMSFRALLAGANRALAGLTYRGRTDFYGDDELLVTVDDGGNFGSANLCVESATHVVGLGDGYTACPQVIKILTVKQLVGDIGEGSLVVRSPASEHDMCGFESQHDTCFWG